MNIHKKKKLPYEVKQGEAGKELQVIIPQKPKKSRRKVILVKKYILPKNFPLKAVPERLQWRIGWLSTILYKQQYKSKTHSLRTPHPLSSKIMMENLGEREYKQTLKCAEQLGLIETNRHYDEGQCRTYTFRPPYIYDFGEVAIDKPTYYDERHIAALTPLDNGEYEDNNHPLNAPQRYVMEWVNKLTIDPIPDKYMREVAQRAYADAVSDGVKNPDTVDMRLATYRNMMAVDIDHGTNCPYGRLHHYVCRMKSEFRKYLRLNGRALYELDIKTSQPIWLGIACVKNYSLNSPILNTVSPNLIDSIPICSVEDIENTGNERGTLSKSKDKEDRSGETLPADLLSYLYTLQDGDLYAIWKDNCGSAFDNMSRDTFKADYVYHILYGPTQSIQNEAYFALKRLYPTLVAFMDWYKGTGWTQYKELPRYMQRSESNLMYNAIVKRLMTEHPEIPVITIHDSILTYPEYADTVSEVMKAAFSPYGIVPQLKGHQL
jgi:hypothetical protein